MANLIKQQVSHNLLRYKMHANFTGNDDSVLEVTDFSLCYVSEKKTSFQSISRKNASFIRFFQDHQVDCKEAAVGLLSLRKKTLP